MTDGHLHPSDEKALGVLVEKLREILTRLDSGRPVELVVSRQRGNNRITGYIVERHYPVEENHA